nr:PspC domain-containing protein [Bacteroidaceae bacterium]
MKRNITINMCGRLFAIDEDAYEVLSTYESSLRRYFQGREGGEEIADDLEERMAEILEELQGNGEAVSIEHVQEVIRRLGNPQQMDGDEETTESAAEATAQAARQAEAVHEAVGQEGSAPRRLYRNLQDRKWMGVLSGFAAYFGGDPLWWRIGYVSVFVLTLFSLLDQSLYGLRDPMLSFCLLLVIAYIALAILMPVAQTPEERLRMKGRAVTPESLAQEVQGDAMSVRETPRDEHLGCIGGFFRLVTFLFQLIVGVLGGALAAAALAGLIFLAYLLFLPSQVNMLNAPEWIADLLPAHGLTLVAIIAGIVALFVLLYALVH